MLTNQQIVPIPDPQKFKEPSVIDNLKKLTILINAYLFDFVVY